jgi:hypothetical protein
MISTSSPSPSSPSPSSPYVFSAPAPPSPIKLPTLPSLPGLQPAMSASPTYSSPPHSAGNTLLPEDASRKRFGRRPSHDLFECIEQSTHKRLPESHARYVFAQVVEAVAYLDSHGVTHRDIKDENLVIDDSLKVRSHALLPR